MKDNRNNRKKDQKERMYLDEFLAEERFDEEDEDNVTDDTLEFLCIDDETIESYENGRKGTSTESKASLARYEEDAEYEGDEYEGEDEEYEDDDYEDEEYEDDEYADEDEEYDLYDDEEYEYGDERRGVIVRFKHFLAEMSKLDVVVAVLGIVVFAGALMSGVLYANAKSIEKQVALFESVGEEVEGISVIGEGGLLAVSESAKLAGMVDLEEEPEEVEEEENQDETIEVSLNLTSILSDIKIKFINKETGKLIGGVPFEVEVSGGKKTFNLRDEDKDGIIYQTEIEAGTYQVTVKPFKDGKYAEYRLPTSAASVKVTDTIAYKKVDVADEVKSESEINAAKEDTAVQDTVVESTLQDTVEWVESTKTPIGGEQTVYEEVPKQDIPDPWTVGSAFAKLVEGGESAPSVGNTDEGQNPNGDGSEQGQGGKEGSGEEGQEGGDGGTKPPSEEKVSLDPSGTLTLKVGESKQLKLLVNDNEEPAEWTSSDESKASVDLNGNVTAKGPGNATITAKGKSSGKQASCEVTVTQPDDGQSGGQDTVYKSVTISGATEVAVGKTITLTAQTEPQGGKITWSSDNSKVATVDGEGVVTGVAAGTVNISAVCSDSTDIAATRQITVKSAVDGGAKLKDKNGTQMYYKDASGEYREAAYDDYKKYDKFYKKTSVVTEYRYTGWQTIDGSVYFFDKNGNYVTGEQVIQGAKYTFGSDGKLSSGSGSMGIDVSKWNGNIDWNAVKNSGVSYVIIRCGYRGSSTGVLVEDPKFKSNIKGAKAAGLKVGVYFFSQAVNEVEAVEEASMAVSLVSGYGLNYPIFLDVESSGGRGDSIGKDTRTAVCKAFCATVQNSGYTAGIYANKTWLTSYINTGSLTNYKIWLAQYASAPSYTATKYDMWQYSSNGKVSGINGNVDMNISYMGY